MAITTINEPAPGTVTAAHLVYALHSVSILIGVLTAAFIVTAFVTGIPSIVAVIINYVKRDEARGTYLESHFRWQIRTFWFALLWMVVGGLLFVTLVGIPVAFVVWIGTGLWTIYRVVRGWLALKDHMPMYV
jgi:uncharacterized membrane protein